MAADKVAALKANALDITSRPTQQGRPRSYYERGRSLSAAISSKTGVWGRAQSSQSVFEMVNRPIVYFCSCPTGRSLATVPCCLLILSKAINMVARPPGARFNRLREAITDYPQNQCQLTHRCVPNSLPHKYNRTNICICCQSWVCTFGEQSLVFGKVKRENPTDEVRNVETLVTEGHSLGIPLSDGGANSLMQFGDLREDVADYSRGARAAVYALIAASAIFLTQLPKNETARDNLANSLSHICSVVAAFLAGLLWLLGETGDAPGAATSSCCSA